MKNRDHIEILKQIQDNIKVFEWQELSDIKLEADKMMEQYYIIFNNINEITYITDKVYFIQVFGSRKNRKLLFITKKMFEKVDKYIMYIKGYGKEKVYSFVESLNELYPDFNFFDLSWLYKSKISGWEIYCQYNPKSK
jgi:hypothetical protein